jgi:hypothetical protein
MFEKGNAAPQDRTDTAPSEIATGKGTSEFYTNIQIGISYIRELEQA